MGQVRIIGGEWKRRIVRFPDVDGLRPSPDRVRETVFNWLGQTLHGKTCLDLFAGSGILGIEAASRGARRVVSVERQSKICMSLRDTVRQLDIDTIEVIQDDACRYLMQAQEQFDIVFLDPPFHKGIIDTILTPLVSHLKPNASVYLETEHGVKLPEKWETLREQTTRQVQYRLIQYKGS